jgi:hypothetical protein
MFCLLGGMIGAARLRAGRDPAHLTTGETDR